MAVRQKREKRIMIDPAENIVQAEAAIKRMREELQPMNAEDYETLVKQSRIVQDMMFQIERWAITKTEMEDDWAEREASFRGLLNGLKGVMTEIEKKVGVK
jgi:inactivated superfamily I helicase